MNRFHPYGQQPGTPGVTFAGFRAFATPGLARPLPPGPPPGGVMGAWGHGVPAMQVGRARPSGARARRRARESA